MGTSTLAQKKRADAKVAALRPPVRGVAASARRGTGRPVVTLGDVVRMPGAAERDVPADGPTVQANNRIVLTTCCVALGWIEGTPLIYTVGDGQVVLRRADADRVHCHIRVRHQLTLNPAMLLALGIAEKRDKDAPKPTVIAVADPVEQTVRILGAAAIEDAERFTRLARPIRDALNTLGPNLTVSRLTKVLRLLATVDDVQLAHLAALDPADLADLTGRDEAPERSAGHSSSTS